MEKKMSTYTKCMGKRNKKGVKTTKKLWTKKKKKKKKNHKTVLFEWTTTNHDYWLKLAFSFLLTA